MKVELKVNGKAVSADVPPNTLLVQFIREHLRLTGTHVGCDTAQCGACTVIANGSAIKSCNVLAAQMQGAEVTTIEGLAAADGTRSEEHTSELQSPTITSYAVFCLKKKKQF